MATGGATPSSNPKDYGCPDYKTLSENTFECSKTSNKEEIWAKVIWNEKITGNYYLI